MKYSSKFLIKKIAQIQIYIKFNLQPTENAKANIAIFKNFF